MKVFVAVLLACLAAVAMCDDFYGGYGYGKGLKPVRGGVAAPYRNDLRQKYVNREAEYRGSGTGTAKYYGVPGTRKNFGYGYNDGYQNDGYGYNDGYNGYNDGYGYNGGFSKGYGDNFGPSYKARRH